MDITTLKIGDRVVTKKPHACGSNKFVVTRTGADYKLTCEKCGHTVLLTSEKTQKVVRRVLEKPSEADL